MQILRIQDPRDALERARRSELVAYARKHGIREIVPEMPAQLMRKILRSKGLVDIRVEPRQLGEVTRKKINVKVSTAKERRIPETAEPKGVEMDADADLMRQWASQQSAGTKTVDPASIAVPKGPYRNPDRPTMPEVRKECRKHGIKFPPTAKISELLEMLRTVDG